MKKDSSMYGIPMSILKKIPYKKFNLETIEKYLKKKDERIVSLKS